MTGFAASPRRILEARWFLLAVAVVVAAAVYVTGLTVLQGALLYGVIVALVGLLPRAAPARQPAADRSPQADQTWPETGVKLLSEALPDPCIVLDRRGIVRYANRRAVEAFSIRPGEPVTFRLRVPDLLAAFDRVARGGAPERVEFLERVPTERWYSAWFARLDDGSRLGGFLALVLYDLTEQKRVDRIRVDFVANASHELRTPLASLVGFIETLQGPARDDAVARERFLKIMRDQATRMSRLIDDLLSLSRIEMKAHLRPSGEVDLGTVVRHVRDALEPLARELGVEIETVLPAATAIVVGERDELIQVFENLIENGCKYGQSGGRVVVTVTSGSGGGPSVAVRDFGPGIAEDHVPRLTERFYRIDVDASRKHRGTGLGLAIVKHILARHHARMTVESRLGEGATFTVTFPQAAPVTKIDLGKIAVQDQHGEAS
ncbi:MAG: PAS domain-containing protein [Bauldia sp.]|nr:PAS domain-containing protein [Bauldia sp.]